MVYGEMAGMPMVLLCIRYYSSYVFHPMYLETLQAMKDAKVRSRIDYGKYYDHALKRAQKI